MLFAAIDIGSNAARLLFANAYEKRGVIKIDKASMIRIPTRLGEDVYSNNKISKEKAKDFIKTMKAFKLLMDVYDPISYKIYATAAMREAKNSDELIKKVKKETGLKIKIIDGKKEAEIIRSNSKLMFKSPKPFSLYMDMGGGSTELSIERNGVLVKQKSFKIGTLRLLQGQVDDDLRYEMFSWLQEYEKEFLNFHIIGTGGNINKLCKMFGNMENKQLKTVDLELAYDKIRILNVEQRIKRWGFRPDRADVIEPAASLYLFILKKMGIPYIFVPRIGLANGLILKQYREYINK